jgi:lipopolysaccharide export LptBFGC system permease protein LptF
MKFILLIILFLFLMGAFFGFSVFRFIFGGRPAPRQSRQSQSRSKQNQASSKSKQAKKIISRDEGEYVDYEEIKDQNSKL